jgi:imidazolonepropionase-like amidohydrolase
MANVAPATARAALPTFTSDELWAIIDTASALGVKVAAHASDWRRIASLPFDTVEHGNESVAPDAELGTHDELASSWDTSGFGHGRTIWVPTLAAYYTTGRPGSKWLHALQTFQSALKSGFEKIACGGDTGVFAHGENALEMQLMVAAGAPWEKVLSWATYGGWKCVRPATWEGSSGEERLGRVDMLKEDPRIVGDNEVPFGVLRRGFAADIIATTGDLEKDFTNAVRSESISFVMKGGRVYKRDGKEVV